MTEPRYGCFQPKLTCTSCGNPVIINGPVQKVDCAICGESFELHPDVWFTIIKSLDEDYHEKKWKEGYTSLFNTKGLSFESGSWRLKPHCPKCITELPEEKIKSGTDGKLTCGECGNEIDTFPAPAWLKAAYPAAAQIVGGEREGQQGKIDSAEESLPMTCPQCGGEQTITQHDDQVLTCRFCNVQVYIPDASWRKLHPVRIFREWFICLEGPSCKQIESSKESSDCCGDEQRVIPKPGRKPTFDLGHPPARFGRFHLITSCQNCGRPLPLNGPLRQVHCGHCQKESDFSQDFWKSMMETIEEDYHELEWGLGYIGTVMLGGVVVKYRSYREAPACPNCGKIHENPMVPEGEDGELECSQCGSKIDTFPVPGWLKKVYPAAKQIYCGQREWQQKNAGAALVSDETSIAPKVLACPSCGTPLKVTEASERIVLCESCDLDIYIPDGLWQRLHPADKAREWFVRFAGKTYKEIEKEEEQQERALEVKKRMVRIDPSATIGWMLTLVTALLWCLLVAFLISKNFFLQPFLGIEFPIEIVLGIATGVFYLAAMIFTYKGFCMMESDWSEIIKLFEVIIPIIGIFMVWDVYKTHQGIEQRNGSTKRLAIPFAILALILTFSFHCALVLTFIVNK